MGEDEVESVVRDDVGRRRHAVRGGDQLARHRSQRRALVRRQVGGHAGTRCSKRVSTMWSAARRAMATIVEVGLTPDDVTKQLPSTTYKFGTSWVRFHRSRTDVLGSSP